MREKIIQSKHTATGNSKNRFKEGKSSLANMTAFDDMQCTLFKLNLAVLLTASHIRRCNSSLAARILTEWIPR